MSEVVVLRHLSLPCIIAVAMIALYLYMGEVSCGVFVDIGVIVLVPKPPILNVLVCFRRVDAGA